MRNLIHRIYFTTFVVTQSERNYFNIHPRSWKIKQIVSEVISTETSETSTSLDWRNFIPAPANFYTAPTRTTPRPNSFTTLLPWSSRSWLAHASDQIRTPTRHKNSIAITKYMKIVIQFNIKLRFIEIQYATSQTSQT
uniref:Uncharacterized protein n=1 Tax=Glossina palpalis gambiensis TaxID=67801 RepID=A0A1B0BWA2_9MUSC